ncbi:hypothetical protein ACGF07_34360 [Kitasatospora sp. NPDC048194]|uniref:hypothetical protein n=1 Tax=Kitasatospora sp. NPDC048194 TaxID=3364045 RepID=UPI003720E34C
MKIIASVVLIGAALLAAATPASAEGVRSDTGSTSSAASPNDSRRVQPGLGLPSVAELGLSNEDLLKPVSALGELLSAADLL